MRPTNFKILVVLIFTVLVTFSCKEKEEPEPETLKIEGEWNLEKINFLDESVVWKDGVPFNKGTYFKYGPYMYSEVMGYKFGEGAVEKGFRADVLQSFYAANPDQVLWYWNYSEDKMSFELAQVNLQFPPYDFAFKNITNLEKSDDGNTLSFKAQVASRTVGGGVNDVEYVNVEMTLKKGEAIADTKVTILGKPFIIPAS